MQIQQEHHKWEQLCHSKQEKKKWGESSLHFRFLFSHVCMWSWLMFLNWPYFTWFRVGFIKAEWGRRPGPWRIGEAVKRPMQSPPEEKTLSLKVFINFLVLALSFVASCTWPFFFWAGCSPCCVGWESFHEDLALISNFYTDPNLFHASNAGICTSQSYQTMHGFTLKRKTDLQNFYTVDNEGQKVKKNCYWLVIAISVIYSVVHQHPGVSVTTVRFRNMYALKIKKWSCRFDNVILTRVVQVVTFLANGFFDWNKISCILAHTLRKSESSQKLVWIGHPAVNFQDYK